jgi:hypothetical protein
MQKIQVGPIKLDVVELNPMSCPQEGQRFDKVAQEYSEDKAKGQEPRWLT